ncbi:MAG: aldehyde dehydrogenase, partial [Bacteroidales bacterium]|nr:aldehyde dehydrogenase [Bacteroidales bacterium]
MAITSIAQHWLKQDQLAEWTTLYPAQTFNPSNPKSIGVVMAGNIPFVGLHDLLCVLIAGHQFVGKISSKDAGLMQAIVNLLLAIEPRFSNYINLSENNLANFDAVIATGSDNTSRYFEYYFGKYPNIIRK